MQENERQRLLEGSDDPELLRYLEDERIALLLQNEEFVTELKRNKDFMSTLERGMFCIMINMFTVLFMSRKRVSQASISQFSPCQMCL